jgi:hypothetical protein
MHHCYFGYSISKAGPKVLNNVRIMGNVHSNYCDIQLSKKDLLYYDAYGAILRKDIYNNIPISNL